MAINPEIRDQAYLFFVEEAPDLLQAIEMGLLTLRQERSPATIHAIMRSAHSIKGGAASVGLEAIKTIAHRLETIFKALYSDRLEIDARLESQLLQAYDCLRIPLTEQISHGDFDAEQAIAAAEPILSQLETQFQEAIVETENFIPGSAELGVNMAAAIFETDVAQGLAHLEQVLNHPQHYEIAEELRTQAEMFLGFAELLSLDGFAAIAQTVMAAIDRVPNRAEELTQLALSDFRAGREAVLAGDSVGGSPSAALLAFLEAPVESGKTIDLPPEDCDRFALESLTHLELKVRLNSPLEASPDGEPTDTEPTDDPIDWLSEAELEAIVQQELLEQELLEQELLQQELSSETSADSLPAIQNLSAFSELELATLDVSEAIVPQVPTAENQFNLEAVFADFTPPIDHSENSLADSLADFSTDSLTDSLTDLPTDSLTDLFADSLIEEPTSLFEEQLQEHSPDEIGNSIAIEQDNTVMVKMPARPAAYPVASGFTVRVDTDRLERLNNLLGEVTINRNGLALQTDQTRLTLRELRNRFEYIQSTIDQIRTLSDRMLIMPDAAIGGTASPRHFVTAGQPALSSSLQTPHLSANQAVNQAINQLTNQAINQAVNPSTNQSALSEFDSLEMDRYTSLYAATQTLLEEMAQIEEAVEDIVLFNRQSEQALEQHRKMLSQMQDDLMWARMLPLGDVLNRFPRILRDLSNTYNKPIDLSLDGTELLIDKAVLDRLYDPLLHLLRNSFDHGIESAAVRHDRGKPTTGRIEMRASARGRQILIEVRDDGQGLNLDRIRQRAVESGWLSETEVAAATEAQLCELIFAPGFSTAEQVSDLSGRGMGLDVVREQLQALKGSVAVRSIPAQGTTFVLTLPLTLTITNLLICLVNSRPIALRSAGIREIVIPQAHQLLETEQGRYLQWQEQEVPLYRMADLLTYRCLAPELPPSRVLAAVPAPSNWHSPALILKRDQQLIALQIDRLVTEQEFVIKPFGSAIAPPDYTYGCTVLGDGMLVPVIDGQTLLQEFLAASSPDFPTPPSPYLPLARTTTILVVDDALTSRRMLALSLERAGYRVLQARDGQEALEQLQQSQTVELIVCDIEMPNMNGFEFLTHRRQNPDIAKIPTVMLTSRSNDKHRWLAMQLGATGYFTKPYLEQEFLQAIGNLVTNSASENTAAAHSLTD
ncbi:hybrid sensor histidine kinase/response regulator [Leptolyngbya ohadii]|uniref:hybrid sensor histidine kinase/response regulator n=1 Tax=Leptolyngbya ohadii TaxID=1962290 RepID=UPI000B5A0C24|nr:hybrid sensor histidine kinase/response regulator [Leptolyngbya ohadii]